MNHSSITRRQQPRISGRQICKEGISHSGEPYTPAWRFPRARRACRRARLLIEALPPRYPMRVSYTLKGRCRIGSAPFMKIVSGVCKPSSVLDGHLSGPAVASRLKRLPGSATGRRRAAPKGAHASLSILHQVGFTARASCQAAGELLPRLSTLAPPRREVRGISLLHFP